MSMFDLEKRQPKTVYVVWTEGYPDFWQFYAAEGLRFMGQGSNLPSWLTLFSSDKDGWWGYTSFKFIEADDFGKLISDKE